MYIYIHSYSYVHSLGLLEGTPVLRSTHIISYSSTEGDAMVLPCHKRGHQGAVWQGKSGRRLCDGPSHDGGRSAWSDFASHEIQPIGRTHTSERPRSLAHVPMQAMPAFRAIIPFGY